MSVTLKQSWVEEFLRDPVLAAYVLFGVELDTFQAVRLRMAWWIPELIDDSGISTGKTELLWLWANLRAILLPQPRPYERRIIGIYYPTLDSAQSNFQPKYDKYLESSRLFQRELKPMHGGKLGYQSLKGAIQWVYKNGSVVQCPAANFAQDANSQASKRFDDMGIDEAKEIDAKSDGIDRQLLGRVTKSGFNIEHPLWARHILLLGHAEDPGSHPFYRRVKTFRSLIRDGSQRHGLITSCYRDWSELFAKDYRPDQEIRRDRLSMGKAKFRQIWEGIWEHGTEDWYDAKAFEACRRRNIRPETKRDAESDVYGFGWDTATGATRKSDLNAGVVCKARLVADDGRTPGLWRIGARAYRITFPWAMQKRGGDGGVLAGLIHRQHQRFGFSRIVMDPQGGGDWVLKELWKPVQFFDGKTHRVTGLCTIENSSQYPEALPLVCRFTHGNPDLAVVWGEDRFRTSAEGIVEAAHRIARDMIDTGAFGWPATAEERNAADLEAMSPEERLALKFLEICGSQFPQIKTLLGKDGETPKMTKNGFLMFKAEGKRKKDLAYAALYALVAVLSIIMDPDHEEETGDDAVMCLSQ